MARWAPLALVEPDPTPYRLAGFRMPWYRLGWKLPTAVRWPPQPSPVYSWKGQTMTRAEDVSGGGPLAERHAVVIAGGGPTGLMLAGELALAGVDVAIVERRTSQDLDASRGGGLHARTIEVLDQRGIVDRFLAEGQAMQVQGFSMIPWTSATSPPATTTGLRCGSARSSPSWRAGSPSWTCRSTADAR